MIKHVCDWCGDEIPTDQLYKQHAGPDGFKLESVSDTTGKKLGVDFIVSTDGVSNRGDYHVLCILRMIVHHEARIRRDSTVVV